MGRPLKSDGPHRVDRPLLEKGRRQVRFSAPARPLDEKTFLVWAKRQSGTLRFLVRFRLGLEVGESEPAFRPLAKNLLQTGIDQRAKLLPCFAFNAQPGRW